MNSDIIRSRLITNTKRHIEYHRSLPSTNTYLMRLASVNSSGYLYTAVIAGRQTAGRGRFSRSFYSPEDAGLYMSILLPCPPFMADRLPLTVMVGIAAAEAVEAVSGVPVRLKWVNDLIAGGKKLGGILCESSVDAEGTRYIVAGIGINITDAGFPPEIAGIAVSLDRLGGYAEPGLLAAELLCRIDANIEKPKDEILAIYRERMTLIGQRICFSGAVNGEGIILGIDETGKLLVQTENGRIALNSGEITQKIMI